MSIHERECELRKYAMGQGVAVALAAGAASSCMRQSSAVRAMHGVHWQMHLTFKAGSCLKSDNLDRIVLILFSAR